MHLFKKKSPRNEHVAEMSESHLKERLFFHDIINQTHGLLLFLNQKELRGEAITSDEITLLKNEVKTMQSLIRDHYDFRHKNLVHTFDWVPESYAKMAFFHLSQTYLQDVKVKTHFHGEESSTSGWLIYYPSFYRIIHNIIKNISESKPDSVDFEFVFSSQGIEVTSKNEMRILSENTMTESLSRIILNEKSDGREALGLESIRLLAEESGGTFFFEVSHHSWTNRLFLPTKRSTSSKIPA